MHSPLRIDPQQIDEVDVRTGETRTVWSTRGYLAFLAGSLGRELFVYDIGPDGSRLIALDRDRGTLRTLVKELPLGLAVRLAVRPIKEPDLQGKSPGQTGWAAWDSNPEPTD